MATEAQNWVEKGVRPPARDVCQGWYLRNRASNVELSSLVPAAHLYAILGDKEINELVEYFNQNGEDPLRSPISIRQIDGEEVPLLRNDPRFSQEEFQNRAREINQQILKDVVKGVITYSYSTSKKSAFEIDPDNMEQEKVEVTLIPLAVMQSQVSTNDYVNNSYGGVGIDGVNSNLVNSSGVNRRITVNLTFTNPNIIDINYAYQKLLTLNTKYILTYGWYNASGGNAVFSPQTTDPTGAGAADFASYPVVHGSVAGEKEIEIDCTNKNTGGFWSAHQVVLNSYNFNANDLGQLEGSFTFMDELATKLSQTSVSRLAPFIKNILSSGESLGNMDSFEVKDSANFIGDGIAEEIAVNQQLLTNGISNLLFNVAGETRVGKWVSDLANKENESAFGDVANILDITGQIYSGRPFPYGGPGIVQYEVNKRPLFNFAREVTTDAEGNEVVNEDARETIYETEYNSRINFYYLGWITEAVRYGMGALNSAPARGQYAGEDTVDDIEQFGVNFYYEKLPKDSLFAVQYQRLLENTQLKDIKAVVRRVMSYVEETALPPFDPDKEWQQFLTSGGPYSFGDSIKDLFNFPRSSVIGRVGSGQLKFDSAVTFDKIVFKKMTYLEHRNAVIDSANEDNFNLGSETLEGKVANWKVPASLAGWVDSYTLEKLQQEYETDNEVPGISVFMRIGSEEALDYINAQNVRGPLWIANFWFPYDYLVENNPETLNYIAASIRYMANPQLFVNTMKKWWTEVRKATLKNIQEKITDRLFRLEQEGKTILDVLNEPIDLAWLTSRHPVSWEGNDDEGGKAGLLRVLGQPGETHTLPAAYVGFVNEEGDTGYDSFFQAADAGTAADTISLLKAEGITDNNISTFRHYATGLPGRGLKFSEGRWNPYREEIPDASPDPLDPTMEVLDLLWQTRSVNGRKDVNNYGPQGGGVIYDKLTGMSFVPENIYADETATTREWALPVRSVQKELMETFNQSINIYEDGELQERNILDILHPGFTGIDLADYSTAQQIRENEEIQDEINTINSRITERALFILTVPSVIQTLDPVGQQHIEELLILSELRTLWQQEQAAYNEGGSPVQFGLAIEEMWAAAQFLDPDSAAYRKAFFAKKFKDDGLTPGQTDSNIIRFGQYGDSIDNLIYTLENQSTTETGDASTIVIPNDFGESVVDFLLNFSADLSEENRIAVITDELRRPAVFNNTYYKVNDDTAEPWSRGWFGNAARPVFEDNQFPLVTTLQHILTTSASIENWFTNINNNELSETNGGVFQKDLNAESLKEMMDILIQKNVEDLANVRSLRGREHKRLGPASLAEKTKEALNIIGDYFKRILNAEIDGDGYGLYQNAPPVNFYVDRDENYDLIGSAQSEVDFAGYLNIKDDGSFPPGVKQPRFKVLYKGWPGTGAGGGEGYRIGQDSHDIGLTPDEKESLVRNDPIRNSKGTGNGLYVKTKPQSVYVNGWADPQSATLNVVNYNFTGVNLMDVGNAPQQNYEAAGGTINNNQDFESAIPYRSIGDIEKNVYTDEESINVNPADYQPDAIEETPGLGDSRSDSEVTIFSYVSQMEGLGHLTDSIALFSELVEFELSDDQSLVLSMESGDRNYSRLMVGGDRINQKYGRYMANLMALNPAGRRIIIRKKQRVDANSDSNNFVDPTYGDALSYFTGGSTYGDIRNKVPESVADIAVRRDIIDNMLRPNNHRMNLLDFLLQVTAPTAIAAVGGTATLALRNLNGVLSVTPLGVAQDGAFEDYSTQIMDAVEGIKNATEGNDFFGRTEDEEAANKIVESFYVYYKKKFSLVQSVSLAAKADPAYAASQLGNNARWFDSGFSRNFLQFLGYGDTAQDFRDAVAAVVESSPEAHWLRNEQGEKIEDFANQLIQIEYSGARASRITVDEALIQKLPSTFIREFIGFGTDGGSDLVQYWLRENAADISSVYKQYLKRVTLTIHGTANLAGFQQLFIDNVLPGMAGIFQIISVNERVDASGYTTSIECAMQYQVPPAKILNKAGQFVAAPSD